MPHPENYRWIFVDLQDARMQSREGLLGYILESLEMPIPTPCDLDKFMDAVSGKLQKPTVILLDEIGVGLQCWPILLQILCRERLFTLEDGETGDNLREEGLQQIQPFAHLLQMED